MIKRGAFSIPELAITLLIIAIIAASIIKGTKLMLVSRVVSAKSITTTSPVKDIDDLSVWFETTLEESFLEKYIEDGRKIDVWYDVNPQSVFPKDAVQSDVNKTPLYYNEKIKGLPALYFDGIDDYLNFDGRLINRSEYTIFFVEQRDVSSVASRFLGDFSSDIFYLGYNANDLEFCIKPSPPSGCYGVDVGQISSVKIITFLQDPDSGQNIYVNGANIPKNSGSKGNGELPEDILFTIGMSDSKYYKGSIGEIIIYDRALKDYERRNIQKYLSKKWLIKVKNH